MGWDWTGLGHNNTLHIRFNSADHETRQRCCLSKTRIFAFKSSTKTPGIGASCSNYSLSPISDRMGTQTKSQTQSIPSFNDPHSDHSALRCFNLITVDLGGARQRPCSTLRAASWEHPVLNDRNIRRDRWLINHGGTHAVSMGGLHLESTPWAGGHGKHQLTNTILEPGTLFPGKLVSQKEQKASIDQFLTTVSLLYISSSAPLTC